MVLTSQSNRYTDMEVHLDVGSILIECFVPVIGNEGFTSVRFEPKSYHEAQTWALMLRQAARRLDAIANENFPPRKQRRA